MSPKNKYFIFFNLFLMLLLSTSSHGQIRAGAAFLKMLPGARLQSMAAAQSGAIDEPHAIFANPGATGFLREWHWAATYSKWIADIYNASFIYNRKIRNPLSTQTKFSLGLIYQGMPEFDSSDGDAAMVSANDLLLSLSIGQPLSIISKNISIGFNLKYFKSNLDTYSANSFIFDIGLLARTPRFKLNNPLIKYGIFSAGAAVTQLGSNLKFDQIGTPLPKTFRTGISFYAGTHSGLQIQLSADYFSTKDEKSGVGVGAELNWGNRFSINGGYDFSSDLMSNLSLGGTIRLDDTNTSEHLIIPGRNNGLRIELASIDEGEFFSRTYRGGVGQMPIGPERFDFIYPADNDTIYDSNVIFKWEDSFDPDLYDEIQYTLLTARKRKQLENLIDTYDKSTDNFFAALSNNEFSFKKFTSILPDSFYMDRIQSGHHYWAVFAQDLDSHIRFAQRDGKKVNHFYIPLPDIEIQDIKFEHSPWITRDDYHGELFVTISNNGDRSASDFSILVTDSTIKQIHNISNNTIDSTSRMLVRKQIDKLKPHQTTTIQIPWHTNLLGMHRIFAVADIRQNIFESVEDNNVKSKEFYTIPKGSFLTDDTLAVFETSRAIIDIPIITEITFDQNSTEVKPEYLHKQRLEPTCLILAKRLIKNPNLNISLQGFADPNSGENNIQLAANRAEAVRDSMLRLGVNQNQIIILPGEVLLKRRVPANPQDAEWVFEERRCVKITTDLKNEKILFKPVRILDDEDISRPVPFFSDIKLSLPTIKADFYCRNGNLSDSVFISDIQPHLYLNRKDFWSPNKNDSRVYTNQQIDYNFSLTDTLGRNFRTRKKETYLTKAVKLQSYRIILPLKFAKTNTTQIFLWQRILDEIKSVLGKQEVKFRFTGHACKVGPDWINKRLSQSRVNRFVNEFKAFLTADNPDKLKQILARLDKPQGHGEDKPLSIERKGGEKILLGDNNSSMGRIVNRRIELEIYNRNN